jgi:hypothetical protein
MAIPTARSAGGAVAWKKVAHLARTATSPMPATQRSVGLPSASQLRAGSLPAGMVHQSGAVDRPVGPKRARLHEETDASDAVGVRRPCAITSAAPAGRFPRASEDYPGTSPAGSGCRRRRWR